MRKEVIIAIVLGFALGLVITFGIWNANKALKEKEQAPVTEQVTGAPQATPTVSSFSLAILAPEDESVQNEEKIAVVGTTEPGANVVVIFQTGETIVEADNSGKFEAEITLESGTNEINITATNEEGEEATKTIYLVYSATE